MPQYSCNNRIVTSEYRGIKPLVINRKICVHSKQQPSGLKNEADAEVPKTAIPLATT